jgi:AraC family transcriptional regulator of arabinose operon
MFYLCINRKSYDLHGLSYIFKTNQNDLLIFGLSITNDHLLILHAMARIKSGFTGERAVILPSGILEEYSATALGSLLYVTDIGIYPKADFHFRKRSSDEARQYVLIYCIEGEGWYQLENQTYKIGPNQVFILPKGKAHSYGCRNVHPWTIYWLHFDGGAAAGFACDLEKPRMISPEQDSRIQDRLKLFEEIFHTLRNGYSLSNLEYSTTALFHFLGSIKSLAAYRNCIACVNQQRDITDDAIHFMRENIRKRLTLNEIADYLGISGSHFSSLFHKKTGYSPLNYLSHLKIQEACHYLDFSDMKVNQISLMIGFDDPFYFSRLFSKVMGCSPTEYRSRKKG